MPQAAVTDDKTVFCSADLLQIVTITSSGHVYKVNSSCQCCVLYTLCVLPNASLPQWKLPCHVEVRLTLAVDFNYIGCFRSCVVCRFWAIPVPGGARAGRACGHLFRASGSPRTMKLAAQCLLCTSFCFLGICSLDHFVDKGYRWRQTPGCYPGPLPLTIHSHLFLYLKILK